MTVEHNDDLAEGLAAPIDRRQALKRGAVVGGAVVWATPVVQGLIVRTADAASHGGTVPPPPPPPPPPPTTVGLPSHGIALVNCGAGAFAVKIDSNTPNQVTGVNNSNTQDAAQLDEKYGSGNWRQPTAAELALLSGGTGTYSGQPGLYITLPALCGFVGGFAYTFDGSFGPSGNADSGCGDGDKYTNAYLEGSTVWFIVRCNEGSGGE